MTRPCPHIPGFACPIMPGLECPIMPIYRWRERPEEAKLQQCRNEALAAGFLSFDATGRYDRKEGYRPGEGPEWRREGGGPIQ